MKAVRVDTTGRGVLSHRYRPEIRTCAGCNENLGSGVYRSDEQTEK